MPMIGCHQAELQHGPRSDPQSPLSQRPISTNAMFWTYRCGRASIRLTHSLTNQGPFDEISLSSPVFQDGLRKRSQVRQNTNRADGHLIPQPSTIAICLAADTPGRLASANSESMRLADYLNVPRSSFQ